MNKKPTIFLTGATGLVGSYLLKLFLENNHEVYALARSKNNQSANDRIISVLKFWDKKILNKIHNLKIIEGDITRDNLGIKKSGLNILMNRVEEIFHSAAITNFNWPLDRIRKVNVLGTRNILDLAFKYKINSNFRKINHISTAYICGDYKGVFKETDLGVGQNFNSTYEKTKFEAEKVVQQYRKKGLWIDIFRPPLILGESGTGKILKVNQGFYQLIHLWNSEIFDYFPAKDISINVSTVDEISKAIYLISSKSNLINQNYHPFNSHKVAVKEILDGAASLLGFKKVTLISINEIKKYQFSPIQKAILKFNVNLINNKVTFNCANSNALIKKHGLKFSIFNKQLINKMIKFVIKSNFLKHGRK